MWVILTGEVSLTLMIFRHYTSSAFKNFLITFKNNKMNWNSVRISPTTSARFQDKCIYLCVENFHTHFRLIHMSLTDIQIRCVKP